MEIFKLGILVLLILIIIIIPTSIANTNTNLYHSPRSVLGATEKEVLKSNNTVNITLIPKDQIDVIPAVIIEIIDLDTMRVLLNDGMEVVDLIGVKIPTDNSQIRYEKCYGYSIKSEIQKYALGKKIFMIDDVRFKNSDTPHKYIFLEDLTFLNLMIIEQGLTSETVDENYLYREEFAKARLNAQNSNIGVWFETCTISPTPTLQPKVKNSINLSPTIANPYSHLIPSPRPTNTPTHIPPSPTSVPQEQKHISNSSNVSKPLSLNPEILLLLINNHRKEIGKSSFEKDDKLCQLAKERGPELYNEIFVNYNVHAGLTNRNLPYWITENMAHYSSEEQVFNWWMGSTIHRKAIESDHKYSCGECYGNSCAQLFTSWSPK